MQLTRRAQIHVAAFCLDIHATAAITGLELETRAGTVLLALGLRPEAALDVAAEGLNFELSSRSRGEIEPQIAADRFTLELGVGRERQGSVDVA